MSTLTIENLKTLMKDLPEKPVNFMDQFNPYLYDGIKIIESPVEKVQKIALNKEFAKKYLNPEDADRINASLAEIFGFREKSLIPKGTAYLFNNIAIIRSTDAVALINIAD